MASHLEITSWHPGIGELQGGIANTFQWISGWYFGPFANLMYSHCEWISFTS